MTNCTTDKAVHRVRRFKRSGGFTLLELMVVISILGILIGIGAPSLGHWVKNNRIDASAQETLGMLRLARSEAVGRNRTTKVEIRNWRRFWSCEVVQWNHRCNINSNNDRFLRAVEWDRNKLRVRSNKPARAIVAFDERGRRVIKDDAVNITICDERGSDYGVMIKINQVGRATLNDIDTGKGEKCL